MFDNWQRIGLVDADGRHLKYLPGPSGRDTDPAWSPDGRWIAFARHGHGGVDVWLTDANGGNQRLLVRNADQPAWKP